MITKKKYVITVVGTTAIGKTALGIKLAQHFNCDIISADSRQFFKEMTIGTAVPSVMELSQAEHHFIQNLSIHDDYSVGDFEKDALKKIEELHKHNDFVVVVGGSGLYIDAILKGFDDFPTVDPKIREQLTKELETMGISYWQERLKELDPTTFEKIDVANPQRLLRALEVCLGSGKPYSSFLNKDKGKRDFNVVKVGLTAERELIYDRINQRVDIMIENGLVDEARSLYKYKNLNALQTVGYKELFAHFDNAYSLDEAIEEIKKNTRRFAKRQITWFKRDADITWFDLEKSSDVIIAHLLQCL